MEYFRKLRIVSIIIASASVIISAVFIIADYRVEMTYTNVQWFKLIALPSSVVKDSIGVFVGFVVAGVAGVVALASNDEIHKKVE